MDDQTKASTKAQVRLPPRSLTRDVALKVVDRKDLIQVNPVEKSKGLELPQRKLELPGLSQEI